VTDGKEGHRLKFDKVGPTFSTLIAMPAKTDHQKIVMVGATLKNVKSSL